MPKYHINYEGKILPCRARVKKCPYSKNRHGDTYEELYPVVMANYNSVPIDDDLVSMVKSGEPIDNLSCINSQLETSPAPIETMIATLELAIENVGSGDLPKDLKLREERVIIACKKLFTMTGDVTIPPDVPEYLGGEAVRRYFDEGGPIYKFKMSDRRGEMINEVKEDLYNFVDEVGPSIEWRRTHTVYSDEFNRNYKAHLTADYNYYSKSLNTSKMLTQPNWAYNKSKDEIQETFNHMDDIELLSMYDDLTISEREIDKNLEDLDNFDYRRRDDLSDKANDNIKAWYEKNKKLAERVKERKTESLYLLFFVEKELNRRGIMYASN